jgi:hypothetical protein
VGFSWVDLWTLKVIVIPHMYRGSNPHGSKDSIKTTAKAVLPARQYYTVNATTKANKCHSGTHSDLLGVFN